MHAYYLSQWVLFFFIYSFIGWVWESCYVSVRKRRWVNRGFMHGPMLPLYGSGALAVLVSTIGVRENTFRRYVLNRRVETISTPYGMVRRKISSGYGVEREKYEYADLARIAKDKKISLAEAESLVKKQR